MRKWDGLVPLTTAILSLALLLVLPHDPDSGAAPDPALADAVAPQTDAATGELSAESMAMALFGSPDEASCMRLITAGATPCEAEAQLLDLGLDVEAQLAASP